MRGMPNNGMIFPSFGSSAHSLRGSEPQNHQEVA
jgi:hypothetical protein